MDARDFGSDPSGQTDSLAAIKATLEAAHQLGVAVYLKGELYVSDQIVINSNNKNVTALFGDGMGETVISFDKAQTGVFNPNSNETDIRSDAGILIDGQDGKTIADLSVKYTNTADFYRTGESYFGKVSGILVNDADNTLISKVEVSGANRAGVMFTSTETLTKDPNGSGATYKARLIRNEIQEDYSDLPLGENNRIVDCYLHNNRVAGALIAYQANFIAEGNMLSWNGHEADGGTGYGIAAMAGSYNYGLTFRNNTTDHNYRKGLDVHDGNNVVITGNTSIGDRLYGIGVYNRQFTMDTVKITNNTIIQDPDFRLETDDNPNNRYHGYSGIQLQTNTQRKDLHSADYGTFEISGNTIQNLTLYKNEVQTYGIEFRNHEQKMDYTLNITDNDISGDSTKYLIAIINNTKDQITKTNGPGSGTINIIGNQADIGEIASGTMPIFINEENTDGSLRGLVTVQDNFITVREKSNGSIEGIQMIGNAASYNVVGNVFELHGTMDHAIVSIHGSKGGEQPDLNVIDNLIFTDNNQLSNRWIESVRADVTSSGNSHNDTEALAAKIEASQEHASAGQTESAGTENVLLQDIGQDLITGADTYDAASVYSIRALQDIGSDTVTGGSGQSQTVADEHISLVSSGYDAAMVADSGSTPELSDLLAAPVLELTAILPEAETHSSPANIFYTEYTGSDLISNASDYSDHHDENGFIL